MDHEDGGQGLPQDAEVSGGRQGFFFFALLWVQRVLWCPLPREGTINDATTKLPVRGQTYGRNKQYLCTPVSRKLRLFTLSWQLIRSF